MLKIAIKNGVWTSQRMCEYQKELFKMAGFSGGKPRMILNG